MMFRRLLTDSNYFRNCVAIKAATLLVVYFFLLSLVGYGEGVLYIFLLSALIFTADIRLLLFGFFVLCSYSAIVLGSNLYFYIPLTLLSFLFGGWLSILIHTTSHEIIKNKFVNRLIGELTAFFMMIGFINFLYIHIMHHKHSDDVKDPHSNISGVGFLKYAALSVDGIKQTYQEYLPKFASRSKLELNLIVFCVFLNRFLIIHIMILVFGIEFFSFFLVPAMIVSSLLFAYINFYTHPNKDHARDALIDLNHTPLDKLINFLFAGVLFHKTHHRYPRIFNPQKFVNKKSNL